MDRLKISIENKKCELEGFETKTRDLLTEDKANRLDFVKNCIENEARRNIDLFLEDQSR